MAVKHEGKGVIHCSSCSWNGSQMNKKGIGIVESRTDNWDHSKYSVVKVQLEYSEVRVDLKKFAVTH